MFALWRILGFRRLAALWLMRRAWRMYTARRSRTRSGR
jgi:hypothetical protein